MLGLGLAVTVGKRILGGVIESLMSALRGRAEYSENNTDSKAVVKDIDNYELLDKATILLTPTATSDALVHSVKTYTGDDIVTNGGFDTDSNWTKDANWSIASGKATSTGSGRMFQSISFLESNIGTRVKVSFDIVELTSDGVKIDCYGAASEVFTEVGTHTFTGTTTNSLNLYINNSGTGNLVGSIDNLSVTVIDADFDFDRASSATRINSDGLVQDMQSITDPELVLNGDFEELGDNVLVGNNSTFDSGIGDWLTYTNGIIAHDTDKLEVTLVSGGGARINTSSLFTGGQAGKTLKIRARIWQGTTTRSNIAIYVGSVQETVNISSTPTYFEVYLKPTSTGYLTIYSSSDNGTFFIDDISVQQVDPNSRWGLGTGWSIEDGKANATNAGFTRLETPSGLNAILTVGNTYKCTFDVIDEDGGEIYVEKDINDAILTGVNSVGSYSVIFVAADDQLRFQSRNNSSISIDNVSVKEVTFSDDVDLARISYDSNGENGHILLEPTSTNLVTYSEDIDSLDNGVGEVGVNSTLTYESDVVAPDGSLGVYRIQNPATASTYLKVTNDTTAAQSMSVWVKAKTVGTNNQFTLYRDGTGSSPSDVKTATGEWQRFEYSWSTVGSGAYFINNDGDTYASDLYVWGIQVENLPYATSYIPTLTGSTVTRAAETLTGSGNSTLINSTEGVLYAEIAALANDGTFREITLNDGSGNNVVEIRYFNTDNLFQFVVRNGGSAVVASSFALTDATEFAKIAFSYKTDDYKMYVNGVEVATDTSGTMPSGLNNLSFNWGGSNPFYGKCKALAVFNEALSDDELELLTGVTNYGSFGELASANGYTII